MAKRCKPEVTFSVAIYYHRYININRLAGFVSSGTLFEKHNLENNTDSSSSYSTDLTPKQTMLLKANLDGVL